jgi:hypothetical protein
VALDLVARRLREVAQSVIDRALIEVLDVATACADDVVVVAALRDHVTRGPVFEEYPADDSELSQ